MLEKAPAHRLPEGTVLRIVPKRLASPTKPSTTPLPHSLNPRASQAAGLGGRDVHRAAKEQDRGTPRAPEWGSPYPQSLF